MRNWQADTAPTILLFALIILWGVLFYVSIDASKYPGAAIHPSHAEMQIAGEAAAADADLVPFGAAVGCLMVFVFTSCLLFGAGKNGRSANFLGIVAVLVILVVSVFLTMMSNVQGYLRGESVIIVGGFPLPTAQMLYGVWICPLVFLVVYVLGFNRWVMTDADRERLAELVKNTRKNGEVGE